MQNHKFELVDAALCVPTGSSLAVTSASILERADSISAVAVHTHLHAIADPDALSHTPDFLSVFTCVQKGGGAKSFNFSALSQDLLAVTLEIPFSVPPYMSLIARSVVTLEGLALMGDENYQMVAQAYPFVVRKVLRNEDAGASSLLRSIIYDSSGNVKPTRMNALLNAALGYVSDKKEGFIDFDAVPADGASVKVRSKVWV